jgi:hypothetical protein
MGKIKETQKGIMILSGENNNLFMMHSKTKHGEHILMIKQAKYHFDKEQQKFKIDFGDEIIWLDRAAVGKLLDYFQKVYNEME